MNPVSIYWILESGRKEDLNLIESKNRYEISLTALDERKIILEKIGDDYKAIMFINGRPSILEKVYVTVEEKLFGLPEIYYIDLYGYSLESNSPVKERIIPG